MRELWSLTHYRAKTHELISSFWLVGGAMSLRGLSRGFDSWRNRQRGIVFLALCLEALLAGPPAARPAETLSIADFVGHFHGAAQFEAGDRFFIQQDRDADVDLRVEPGGFLLRWTTIIHAGQGVLRHRIAEIHFVSGPAPGQFQTADPLVPFTGRPMAWAYVQGQTLVVHVMSVLADGSYELQTYERTLTGNEMKLHFSRTSSGDPELVVSGRLTRQPQ
jgi:hypothetical protein